MRTHFLLVLLWFSPLHASAGDEPLAASVVVVRYLVSEQSPERVEEMVTNPLERILAALPRVSKITSTTGHGVVNVEIQFDGGATEQDLATVSKRIEELALDGQVEVTSRSTETPVRRSAEPPGSIDK